MVPCPGLYRTSCMKRFFVLFSIALALWLALFCALFGVAGLWQADFDIQLHNTYFVFGNYQLQRWTLPLAVLLVLLVATLLRWSARSSYSLLAIAISSGILFLWLPFNAAYTVYPPLDPTAPLFDSGSSNPLITALWILKAASLILTLWAVITLWRRSRSA